MRYNFRIMHMINQCPSATALAHFLHRAQVHLNPSERFATPFFVRSSHGSSTISFFPMSVKSRYNGCRLDSQTSRTYLGNILVLVIISKMSVRITYWISFLLLVIGWFFCWGWGWSYHFEPWDPKPVVKWTNPGGRCHPEKGIIPIYESPLNKSTKSTKLYEPSKLDVY